MIEKYSTLSTCGYSGYIKYSVKYKLQNEHNIYNTYARLYFSNKFMLINVFTFTYIIFLNTR